MLARSATDWQQPDLHCAEGPHCTCTSQATQRPLASQSFDTCLSRSCVISLEQTPRVVREREKQVVRFSRRLAPLLVAEQEIDPLRPCGRDVMLATGVAVTCPVVATPRNIVETSRRQTWSTDREVADKQPSCHENEGTERFERCERMSSVAALR